MVEGVLRLVFPERKTTSDYFYLLDLLIKVDLIVL